MNIISKKISEIIPYDKNPRKNNKSVDFVANSIKEFGCLRVNYMFYDCDQSTNKGGCANYRNMGEEKRQFELLRKKWGSDIIKYDSGAKKSFDYNPIVSIPIKGI